MFKHAAIGLTALTLIISPATRAYEFSPKQYEFSQKLSDQCHQVFFAGMYVSCYITCRNSHTNGSEDEINQYCMNSCYVSRDKTIAARIKKNTSIVPEEICPSNTTTNTTTTKEHRYSDDIKMQGKLWPGEKPSATAESAKNRPLIPEEKIQQQEPNERPQKAPNIGLAQQQEPRILTDPDQAQNCVLTPEERGQVFDQMLNNMTDPTAQEELARAYKDAIRESLVHPNDPATQKKAEDTYRKLFGIPERCRVKRQRYPTNPPHPPPQSTGRTGNWR